ncbi:MAG TPA: thioredoxin family protein [Geminicoccus sp.]|jgi:thioredoxin-like negative regulator of GroEL|uniref:thioredoxin family protein n=1 Tax=Geminicoccus sp. TaxID=2024832 RepID=UPI002E2FF2F9|nr:thioredoxin family protein [Geminicoccus sp.]HEX2527848.1 thioredoxin family protein [Geminicoccus sp.]
MPLSRRLLLALAVPAFCVWSAAGFAAETMAYTEQAFAKAQEQGKPILVDITAPWCPTCKAQRPILEELAARPEFADLVILEVDFDSQKDVVRSLGARMQSTLIAFKGAQEVGRSVGDTNQDSIAALLGKTA